MSEVRALEQIVSDAQAPAAFNLFLLALAAAVALILGAIGVYGVLSYMVSRRTGEIGIRMALGARAADVNRMVLGRGAAVAALGIVLGLVGAAALTRFMSAMLFGVSPTDPATYATVAVVLVLTALLAAYLPARRAASIDPIEALRAE
ncbi:MAG: FtsX-like permease family protein [Acidobacteriota bacterium]